MGTIALRNLTAVRLGRGPVAVVLAVALLAGPVPAVSALAPTTQRVNLAQDNSQANRRLFGDLAISTDGRFVAFASDATNLVPFDTNGTYDIFVRDRAAGTTSRVSIPQSGGQANDASFYPSLSADGRYVAFISRATNLVTGDTNHSEDVFVRDRIAGTTALVSLATDGFQANLGASCCTVAISGDGQYVAFQSTSSNVVPGDSNGFPDIFVRDRFAATTERISISANGGDSNAGSGSAALSADGRYVAFASSASNLVADDTNESPDIFVRDRVLGTTERVSVAGDGSQAEFGNLVRSTGGVSISADGRYVAFFSYAMNLVPGDTNETSDVFVRDRVASTTERVSGAANALGFSSADAAISADGRFVAFSSLATNLVAGDTNGFRDAFVRDRTSGMTERVSIPQLGGQANSNSGTLAISGDGRFVAYTSAATNLVAGDTNGFTDVFVRDRATTVGLPTLSVLDAAIAEGAAGQSGTLAFKVSLSAASSQNVTFRFWTNDVTARDGGDYQGVFGTRTIPAGSTSTTINIQLFGDSSLEFDETLHLNIDVPVNAIIVDGQAVGTIVNDDFLRAIVGTPDVTPLKMTVAPGERAQYVVKWTVPSGNWHDLQTVEVRIGEGGLVTWVRLDEATGRLQLVDPVHGPRGPAFAPGSNHRFETSRATLDLTGTTLQGSGPTGLSVSLTLDLTFKQHAAGHTYPLEVRATNDAGQVQGFDHAATVTISQKHGR